MNLSTNQSISLTDVGGGEYEYSTGAFFPIDERMLGNEGGNVVADACPSCVADLDDSGAVDFDDLVRLLSDWGLCP